MSKLKMWNAHASWEEAEKVWEEGKAQALAEKPLKGLTRLPNMPGMTPETAKNLKWKSIKWMISKDHDRKILKGFLKHPLRHAWAFLRSMWQKKPYRRDGDFFLYGLNNVEEFCALLDDPNTVLAVGFSYCHKPFECPSGRFTDKCQHDLNNPVCKQCFIGKCVHALPEKNTVPLFIPTVHYIGAQILDLIERHPNKRIIFLITACEMTLEMFGDFGNMSGIVGVGVRLDGRICNTMQAFALSEEGIKPGLTVVLPKTQERMLALIRKRRESPAEGLK